MSQAETTDADVIAAFAPLMRPHFEQMFIMPEIRALAREVMDGIEAREPATAPDVAEDLMAPAIAVPESKLERAERLILLLLRRPAVREQVLGIVIEEYQRGALPWRG